MLRTFLLTLLGLSCLSGLTDALANPSPTHFPVFQVIQDALTLDNATVKNAAIIMKEDNSYGGLHVELKSEAAKMLNEMTTAGKGRRMNLVFNNVVIMSTVIQGPLDGNFLISGISQEDAVAFLNVLNANKPKTTQEE